METPRHSIIQAILHWQIGSIQDLAEEGIIALAKAEQLAWRSGMPVVACDDTAAMVVRMIRSSMEVMATTMTPQDRDELEDWLNDLGGDDRPLSQVAASVTKHYRSQVTT